MRTLIKQEAKGEAQRGITPDAQHAVNISQSFVQPQNLSSASRLSEPETSDRQEKDIELLAIQYERQQLEHERRKIALEERQLALKARELDVIRRGGAPGAAEAHESSQRTHRFSHGTYSGDWRDGNESSQRTHRFSHGAYSGGWCDGRPDGHGTFTFDNNGNR
jgi:predicted phage gp36 major capsid-like protein